jgi:hypothetical protein
MMSKNDSQSLGAVAPPPFLSSLTKSSPTSAVGDSAPSVARVAKQLPASEPPYALSDALLQVGQALSGRVSALSIVDPDSCVQAPSGSVGVVPFKGGQPMGGALVCKAWPGAK